MIKGFIRATSNGLEMQRCIEKLQTAGVPPEHIIISDTLNQIILHLSKGDSLIVNSLSDTGSSLQGIFSSLCTIYSKGANLVSIKDQWINEWSKEPKFLETITHLNSLNFNIISSRTKKGLEKAAGEGKILGRPVGSKKRKTKEN